MGSPLFRGVTSLLMVLSASVYAGIEAQGASVAECRDRYFLVSTDLNFTGNHFWFEIVDNGVHKLEANYAAECGYTLSTVNAKGFLILRVSYFACHVENKDDAEFTLHYQIVKLDESGKKSTHPSQISCKLDRDWKPREVVCEENYMEVSVRWNIFRFSESATEKDWDMVPSGDAKLSEWQLLIKRSDAKPILLTFEEARNQGYMVTSTAHRIVFRSPYNKTLAEIQMVDGIEVETINATVVFRQDWVLASIETIPACAINPGTFNGSHLGWTVPKIMSPLTQSPSKFEEKAILMGVDGHVVDRATMNSLNYRLDIFGSYVTVSVPLWAIGGVYESRAINNQYHRRYTIQFYLQHLWADDMFEETEHRSFRLVGTSYIPWVSFTVDQTKIEERNFTVYLGNVPHDVDLTAVNLNGEPLTVTEASKRGYPITHIPHSNGSHAYVIRVPIDDPIVLKMHLGEGVVQFFLEINYTLDIMPQGDPYYHPASVVAQHKDYFHPVLNGVCTEKGIIFRIDQKKLGYMWEVSIGDYALTPELAARHGYFLLNDSQSMTLEVPLFTPGYVYEDINLRQFSGTFEIVSRDTRTQKIAETIAKRCLFKTNELIVCTPDGVVTVVINRTRTLPTMDPWKTTLLDKACKPKESDDDRALFTFHVNTCGTRIMVNGNYLTYENEVVFNRPIIPAHQAVITRDPEFRLTVNCIYPVNYTARLYTDRTFLEELQVSGVGSITENRRYFDHGQMNVSNIHNGIVRGSKSEDLKTLKDIEEYNSAFPYVPVVGVTIAVLGTLLAALIKRKC
ncbi:hypothetical protein SKAU_G00371680 [Synaphobranchus kaupii]|uniref:ZP domain-containing protein n=1 Tax=Synaphobranchus kaupii TaxID=118154 RepID=A0A9Q1EG63_SYNKA|nr:hypothetical protein SKAU_G00371680 [Synaphobranchus kaupii]